MKRFYIFPLLCLLFLAGCDDSADDATIAASLKLDATTTISVDREAGTTEVWFETNQSWTASIEAEDDCWSIEPTSGTYGTKKVTVSFDENTGYSSRSAVVTVTIDGVSQSATIEQQQGIDALFPSEDELWFEAEGGDVTIEVANNMAYEVTIEDSWLTSPATKAYGVDEITLSAAENTTGYLRSTTVAISSLDDNIVLTNYVTVYQKPSNILKLDTVEFSAIAAGEVVPVGFEVSETYTSYMVSVPTDAASWVSATVDETGVINFTIAENTTGLDRTTTVTFAAGYVLVEGDDDLGIEAVYDYTYQNVIITQAENKVLQCEVFGSYVSGIGMGDTVSLAFSTNVDFEVVIPEEAAEWLSTYNEDSAVAEGEFEFENGVMQFVLAENNSGDERDAVVTFVSTEDESVYFEATIHQAALFLLESDAKDTFIVPATGDIIEITVQCYDYMMPDLPQSNMSWIYPTDVNGDGNVFEATENENEFIYSFKVDEFVSTGDFDREGEIYITRSGLSDSLVYKVYQSYIVDTEAGILRTVLLDTYDANYANLLALKITGEINATDLSTIASLKHMQRLDLSEVTIVGDIIVNDTLTVDGNAIPTKWLYGNNGLESLVLPDNLTIIGESAFENCTALAGDLSMPSTVTAIYKAAYRGCTSIDGGVTFSDPLTIIGEEAFANCSSMTGGLYFYNNLLTIEKNAFNGCSSLDGSIKLSRSMEIVEEGVFANCSQLGGGLHIPVCVLEIHDNAFKGCTNLSGELTITYPLESIGESAFEGCSSLTGAITLPESLTSLGASAFMGCTGFTSLSLTESITEIKEKTFANCSSIASLSLTSTLISIGDYAFYRCTSIAGQLVIGSRIESIGEYAFYGCTAITSALNIPANLMSIGKYAFAYCSKMTGALTISSEMTELSEGLFMNSGLSGSITFPTTLEKIGLYAISGTGQKGTITFPTSVTTIEEQVDLAATAITFRWTEDVPEESIKNFVSGLGNGFRVGAFEEGYGIYTITVPFGSGDLYTDCLEGYVYQEASQYE